MGPWMDGLTCVPMGLERQCAGPKRMPRFAIERFQLVSLGSFVPDTSNNACHDHCLRARCGSDGCSRAYQRSVLSSDFDSFFSDLRKIVGLR